MFCVAPSYIFQVEISVSKCNCFRSMQIYIYVRRVRSAGYK